MLGRNKKLIQAVRQLHREGRQTGQKFENKIKTTKKRNIWIGNTTSTVDLMAQCQHGATEP